MFSSRYNFLFYVKVIFVIGGFAFLVYYFWDIFLYFIMGLIVTIVGRPLCEALARIRLYKKRVPRGLSAGITLIVFYILILAFIALFIPLIVQQVEILSSIKPEDVLRAIRKPLGNLEEKLAQIGIVVHIEEALRNYLAEVLSKIFDSSLLSSIINVVSKIGSILTALFAASFMAYFFLQDPELLKNLLFQVVPPSYKEALSELLEDLRLNLQKYFIALIIQTSCVTFLSVLFLSLIGVKNALLIGFMCGALNLIPYIGPIISNILSLLIILSTHIHQDFYTFIFPLQAKAFIALLLVQLIDNALLQPIIYSNTLKSHPLEIFVVTLMAARLAGIPGMIAAIPAYTVLRILIKELIRYFKNTPTQNSKTDAPLP
ncbi:MAG: AI-2E family transporter [Bacteroidia bacterium]|nr:AI-2E family transporter [Bacteroidia bacterium]MDW8158087.1 AI-2E family transporter [Bacteroidia bacterium]